MTSEGNHTKTAPSLLGIAEAGCASNQKDSVHTVGAMTATTTLMKEQDVQEETWEHADFSVTQHSPRHIPLLLPYNNNDNDNDDQQVHHPCIDILSVDTSNMSLLDVCNYVNPDDRVDGSGHCVWMGALFFVHAMALLLGEDYGGQHWWSSLFQDKVSCEMGCGTGAAGIGLLKLLELLGQQQRRQGNSPSNDSRTATTKVIFADNDTQALDLCRQNCHTNAIPEGSFEIVCQQPWSLSETMTRSTSDKKEDEPPPSILQSTAMDTIFATDVLYDLTIIRPFLETASRLLEYQSSSSSEEGQEEGNQDKNASSTTAAKHLIISHVPRWFLPRRDNNKGKDRPVDDDANDDPVLELERHIVQHAHECGFHLIQTTRPSHLLTLLSSNNTTSSSTLQITESVTQELEGMAQAGAVLWVFRKQEGGKSI